MGCISTKREVKVKGLHGIKDKRDLLTYSDNLEKEKSLNMPILKHIANRFNIKKMSNEKSDMAVQIKKLKTLCEHTPKMIIDIKKLDAAVD